MTATLLPANLVRERKPFTVRWPLHEWCCGLCNATEMTRAEHRQHMALTHDRVYRKPLPLALVRPC